MFRKKQRNIYFNRKDLIDFEQEVHDRWEQGLIKGPVHLSYSNELELIDIFQYVNEKDWVFSTWRNHYHALLHGVPKDKLWEYIMSGKSISFQCPEKNFFSSAIVGGVVPIAVGTSLGLKFKNVTDRMVWCFVGDMTSESGTFYEAVKYSIRNELPIHFVIEDNGLSTNTPTQQAWGMEKYLSNFYDNYPDNIRNKYITKYCYIRDKYPHVGIGKFIHF